MRFSKRVKPNSIGPLTLIGITFATAIGILTIIFGCGLIARASAGPIGPSTYVVGIPQAEITATLLPLGTVSPTPTSLTLGQLLAVTEVSVTPIVDDPRPPTNTPTSVLQPTGFYVAPVNPTPIPTPILPEAAPFPESCDGPGRMNILIIGMDGRSANYDLAARADALMVVGVNFGDKTAQILSLPRDLWVQIPEVGNTPLHENRINTAYGVGIVENYPGGGPAFQAFTISHNFGVRIDRTVVLNFTAFETGVDTIGGIDLEVPRAVHDEKYPDDRGGTLVLDIPAGWVHMDGTTSLMYARTRHQDSDFGRMRRQQQVMMAIRDKLLSPEVIPVLPSLAQLLYSSVRTDMSLDEVALLGCAGPQIGGESITRIVIDNTMAVGFRTESGAAVLKPQMDLILPLLEAFATGQ